MSDLLGQQLGNYRIQQLLGSGGFGDVYLGEHIHLKTQAAIKVLQARLTYEDMQNFLQEARTIARLDHPNILRTLEFGVEQPSNIPFLVMTYAPNGTMRQRHPRGSKVPPGQVASYVRQIAGALQYAHDQKFIHRDIKPENFLLGRNNEVLLSDFGTALLTQTSHSLSTKNIIGTAAYMAPEQLQGKPVPASDQYSLATVVYEWLSGVTPFQGSFMELYSQHLNIPPTPLHEKVPGLSQDIAQVVHQALAKEVRFRFPDIQTFADAFTRAYEPTLLISPPPQQTPAVAPPPPPDSLPIMQPASLGSVAPVSLASSTTLANSGQLTPAGNQSAFANSITPPAYQQPGSFSRSAQPSRGGSSKRTLGMIGAIAVILLIGIIVGASVVPGLAQRLQAGNSNANQSGTGTLTVPGSSNTSGATPTIAPSPTPTPSPTPSAYTPGSVIYKATFDQADFNNWSGASTSQWKLVRTGEIGSDGTATDSYILWYQSELPVQNYAVEAKIEFVRYIENYSGEDWEFGVIARGDGNEIGYEGGMVHTYDCDSSAIITLTESKSYQGATCVGILKRVARTIDENVHTYRLEVRDNTIQLFIDGQARPLASTTDNTLIAPGRVGLRSVRADINVMSFTVTAL